MAFSCDSDIGKQRCFRFTAYDGPLDRCRTCLFSVASPLSSWQRGAEGEGKPAGETPVPGQAGQWHGPPALWVLMWGAHFLERQKGPSVTFLVVCFFNLTFPGKALQK